MITRTLPDPGKKFLTYTGMETDLIFTQGVNLPGFATFPLLETAAGRAHLTRYLEQIITLARAHNMGAILESTTWMANADRAAELGYAPEDLRDINRQSIEFMAQIRARSGGVPILLSANIGPRRDAYGPAVDGDADRAQRYHDAQIQSLAGTEVDFLTAYTIANTAEATGIIRAAQHHGLPVVVSFTVETDGRLPSGTEVSTAIDICDAATAGYAAYYMINCAHPDHLAPALGHPRLCGIVANASRCSHAELDNATQLDAGDPVALAAQMAALCVAHPGLGIFGGCCGTSMAHLARLAEALQASEDA